MNNRLIIPCSPWLSTKFYNGVLLLRHSAADEINIGKSYKITLGVIQNKAEDIVPSCFTTIGSSVQTSFNNNGRKPDATRCAHHYKHEWRDTARAPLQARVTRHGARTITSTSDATRCAHHYKHEWRDTVCAPLQARVTWHGVRTITSTSDATRCTHHYKQEWCNTVRALLQARGTRSLV